MDYQIWYGDLSKENIRKLIAHCDKKIDRYFAFFDKKIERIVKAEMKKIAARNKKAKK